MAGVGDARLARVRGRGPVGAQDRDLAHGLIRVGGGERGERLLGRLAGLEQLQPERPVAPFRERLRGHGADPGLRPEDAGAAVEGA